jgi:metallo-beta-lactamase class B
MPYRITIRRVLLVLVVILAPVVVFLYTKWIEAGRNGGQRFAEPFQIAGNTYYVGANDVTSFLITGPEGHVLIDGGYPGTPKLILASIRKLGFNIKDVKVLLNSEQHYDHAGGLAELQDSSGAKLFLSEPSADVVASGGYDKDAGLLIKIIYWMGLAHYPEPRVDRRLKDGDTVRVGPIELVAHITPGHTKGCTTWTWKVRDGDRDLNVVAACSLAAMGMHDYPGYSADFERTFTVLRNLPVDIWVTSHAREWGRYRKFVQRSSAENPVNPFIDRAGYMTRIDSAQAQFRRGVRH